MLCEGRNSQKVVATSEAGHDLTVTKRLVQGIRKHGKTLPHIDRALSCTSPFFAKSHGLGREADERLDDCGQLILFTLVVRDLAG